MNKIFNSLLSTQTTILCYSTTGYLRRNLPIREKDCYDINMSCSTSSTDFPLSISLLCQGAKLPLKGHLQTTWQNSHFTLLQLSMHLLYSNGTGCECHVFFSLVHIAFHGAAKEHAHCTASSHTHQSTCFHLINNHVSFYRAHQSAIPSGPPSQTLVA